MQRENGEISTINAISLCMKVEFMIFFRSRILKNLSAFFVFLAYRKVLSDVCQDKKDAPFSRAPLFYVGPDTDPVSSDSLRAIFRISFRDNRSQTRTRKVPIISRAYSPPSTTFSFCGISFFYIHFFFIDVQTPFVCRLYIFHSWMKCVHLCRTYIFF